MKCCASCKIKLSLCAFGIDKNRKDGRNPYCKVCRAEKTLQKTPRMSSLMKECNECKENLSTAKFGTRLKRGIIVLQSVCKSCMFACGRKWAKTRRENYRERELSASRESNRKRRADDPEWKSREWIAYFKRDPKRAREIKRKSSMNRRAKTRDLFVEKIDPMVVYNRDQGICGICNTFVWEEKWHIDHVFPLVLGGEHAYSNVQLAHATCNLSKGAGL